MNKTTPTLDLDSCLAKIAEAQKSGSLTEPAVENIKIWLTDSRYADYAPAVAEHIAEEKWQELDDVCLLYTSPSPRDQRGSRMPSSA